VKPPHFLVFARPRSRTAWLANFLTYGDAFCLHEPMADHATLAELSRRLQRPFIFGGDVQRIGIIDTGLIHAPGDVLEAFPDARVLFVTSSPAGLRRFAIRHKLDPGIVELVNRAYERTWSLLVGRAHFVSADELTSSASAATRAWEITGTRKPFPMARWRALRGLNVQVDADALAARIRRTCSS